MDPPRELQLGTIVPFMYHDVGQIDPGRAVPPLSEKRPRERSPRLSRVRAPCEAARVEPAAAHGRGNEQDVQRRSIPPVRVASQRNCKHYAEDAEDERGTEWCRASDAGREVPACSPEAEIDGKGDDGESRHRV